MNEYVNLIIGFARTGVLGYGGGPSTIPLIEFEAVKKYKWMTNEEFGETLALANTLPGPIATKMAAHIGYKVKGSLGAIIAILAHIVPSLVCMLGLFSFLYAYRTSSIVSGMVQGVTPIIGVMLAVLAYQFLENARKGLGLKWMGITLVAAFLFIEILAIHPGIVIAVFLTSAFIVATLKQRKQIIMVQGKERQL